MEIDKNRILDLYWKGSDDDKKLLRRIVQDPSIFEPKHDIRTYEDACRCLGITAAQEPQNIPADLLAIYKLQVITRALNGPYWHHSQNGREIVYYVAYYFIDQDKFDHAITDEQYLCTKISADTYVRPYIMSMVSGTAVSSRLAYRSQELAFYSAIQFKELWAQATFHMPDDTETQD